MPRKIENCQKKKSYSNYLVLGEIFQSRKFRHHFNCVNYFLVFVLVKLTELFPSVHGLCYFVV